MTENVNFFSGGRERPALLHRPVANAEGERFPAVVLAHGLANDREEAGQFRPLAERLVDEGHVVLRFDFRGGVRDVDPGRHLPASEWSHDLLAAIAFVRDRDDVDPGRVGVVGASCGGSVAVTVAALEPRLRYVVTLGCFADGERWLRELWTRVHGTAGWERFMADAAEDRCRRAAGLPSRRVPLVGAFLPIPEDELGAMEEFLRANPGMLRDLALEVADDLLLFSPEQIGPRGTAPVLLVHGTDDTLVPMPEADQLEAALGNRVTRANIESGQHQLLLGAQRDLVLDVISRWIAQHA